MAYTSKTYSLSDEVIERLEALRAKYGSVNKGLLVALAESLPSAVASLDARDAHAPLPPVRGGQKFTGTLLKPGEKKR